MKELLRKNKLLAGVMLVTIIVACGLIVFAFSLYAGINKSMRAIDSASKEIDAINMKRNPNNVEQSALAILRDKEALAQIVTASQYRFGRFNTRLIDKFIRRVEGTEAVPGVDGIDIAGVKAYSAKFKGVYDSFVPSLKTVGAQKLLSKTQYADLFAKFRSAVVEKNEAKAALFDQAFQDFKNDLNKTTFEDVTDDVAYALFLQGLGLPRSMQTDECLRYCNNMIKLFVDNDYVPVSSSEKNKGARDTGLDMDSTRKETAVKRYVMFLDEKQAQSGLTAPPESNVRLYVRRFQIFESLFKFLKESSQIKSGKEASPICVIDHTVESSSMYGDRSPQRPDYVNYSFKLEIMCTLPQLRDFITRLHGATSEGRFFLIKDIAIRAEGASEAEGAVKAGLEKLKALENAKNAQLRPDSGATAFAASDARPMLRSDLAPGKLAPAYDPDALPDDYGAIRIGSDGLLRVTVSYDYIIFEGDDIK